MKYILYITTSFFATTGVYFFKKLKIPNNLEFFFNLLSILGQIYFWIGLTFYGAAFLCFLYIINKYEISQAIPALLGTYIIFIAIFSFFIMGESISLLKAIALLFLLTGIILL